MFPNGFLDVLSQLLDDDTLSSQIPQNGTTAVKAIFLIVSE